MGRYSVTLSPFILFKRANPRVQETLHASLTFGLTKMALKILDSICIADFAGLREEKEMGITPKLCAKSRPVPPTYLSQCTLVGYFRRTSRANSPKSHGLLLILTMLKITVALTCESLRSYRPLLTKIFP